MHHRYLAVAALAFTSAACGGNEPGPSGGVAGTPAGGNTAAGASGAGGSAGLAGSVGGGGVSVGGTGGSSGLAGGGAGGVGGTGGAADLMPTLLSKTGLFTDMKAQTLAPGVYAYEPQYTLWSDGAVKHRWVYMPPGGKIVTDASAGSAGMEYWNYPAGFKLWKDFTRDGVLIETRLLLKKSGGLTDWYMMAFKWNADHSEAVAVPDGEMNAMGTQHDIPSTKGCTGCHTAMNDNVLGFSALQLSHNIPGSMNLTQATQLGWFTVPPPAEGYTLPGDEPTKKALGYLHANCGICHNNFSKVYGTASLDLWTHLDQLQTVQQTRAYLSMVCDQWPGPGLGARNNPITMCEAGHATGAPSESSLSKPKRVEPHNPMNSSIHDLMALRSTDEAQGQMPPIGTEVVDATGLAAIDVWITSLPAQ
jgi:hypothetical protein